MNSRKNGLKIWKPVKIAIISLLALRSLATSTAAWAAPLFQVYSIHRGVDLGNPDSTPQKDYYINVGTRHGLRSGSAVEVLRKAPTYNLISSQLQQDVEVPIARLRIIHVEDSAAIARLDSFYSADKTPSFSPAAVMVGDLVRPIR